MGALFGTDGIRGAANSYPMDAMTAFALGQALTHVIHPVHRPPVVVIGKDTRISGYMLESALEAGITSMGGIVHMLGVLPTPGIAYITQSMRADAGFVVSASHNPYQDNGIKVFGSDGFKLSDAQEAEIERLMLSGELANLTPPAAKMGRAYRLDDVLGRYIVFLKNSFPRSLRLDGVKIAMDVANGAAYRVAPAVYRELGADVHVINDDPNGFNINADAGAMYPEVLAKVVREIGAQVGFAYDGDADRLVAVDETGQVVGGDQILLINALELKRQQRLTNNAVVSTVMSNLGFRVACEEYGITNYAAQVGDRYVLELMKEVGAVIGGEDSGHTIFLRRHTTGDGILSSLQLLTCMLQREQPLSVLKQAMQVYPQTLLNVDVARKPNLDEVPEVVAAIAAATGELGSHGRVLVRYSGTQQLCRVMVEGPTLAETEAHATAIADAIRNAIGV
ncbi:MAG: phosphoglucosamine mutase [Propionibacteriaceae bacterium]|jgi:phosphoglucosamine mutase|nr:phosphoglucosamine mutase [Propionibacteriaceae bacterium]